MPASFASNKLFRRYTAVVSLLFIVGSLSPLDSLNVYAAEEAAPVPQAGSFEDSLLMENDEYFVKVSPQTQNADRSTMTDRRTYIVQSGDSLSTIARQFEVKTSTILWENNISNAKTIRPGQVLAIPPVDGVRHRVEKNQNLEKIAKAYGVEVQAIQQHNEFLGQFSPGQEIFIPGGKPLPPPLPPAAPINKTIKPAQMQPALPKNKIIASSRASDQNIPVKSESGAKSAVRNTPSRGSTSTRVKANEQAPAAVLPLSGSDEKPAAGKSFIFPVKKTKSTLITQRFSKRHSAFDIGDRSQPPIVAAAGGKVIKANTGCGSRQYGCGGGGYGNYVIIDHGDGIHTLYGHMAYLLVKEGDTVQQGDAIGKMGNTGNSYGATGLHLHFEVRKGNLKLDPANFIL